MSLNLVSPGVKVREVDLTVGRIDAANDQIGALAGPFVRGPVNIPVLVETEQDLVNTFGKPSPKDGQYEYWYTASSYLSYGGTLRVVRSDASSLVNSHSAINSPVNLKIKSQEDYNNNFQNPTEWTWAAKDPGSWGNGLKVCVIDALADQRVSIGTFGIQVGYALTVGIDTTYATANGTVETFYGYIKGIVTQVNKTNIDVKIVSRHDNVTGISEEISYSSSPLNKIPTEISPSRPAYFQVFNNVGTASSLEKLRFANSAEVEIGSATIRSNDTTLLSKILEGDLVQSLNSTYQSRVAEINLSQGEIILESPSPVSFGATTFVVTYVVIEEEEAQERGEGLLTEDATVVDWYDQQTLGLSNSRIFWKSIAPKPATSQYAAERNARNDEIHVVVVDDSGKITGISGNIVEKFVNLSKAVDSRINPSENIYYKTYIGNNSGYIYSGEVDTIQGVNFTNINGFVQSSAGTIAWGQNATGVNFGCIGAKSYELLNGFDYSSENGGMDIQLSDLLNSYDIFKNPAEYDVNFIIGGPSGGTTIFEAQAKANSLINIAENRKDCVACISPYRAGVINVPNSDTQTSNIINFFDALISSSYAVFDSGYKYMYDRFNNEFRYIPLNGDIAGLMARTSINNYPWFSPAGSSRGTINNAIKLALNPSQGQRDLLYPKRINPVIFSPGAGIILFGDKTALSYASAFDRINVRRLFLTLEDTIERAARAQLFEFNDTITRSNFLNIVEPYLRDVKAKRGITDFIVVCDESNNTPSVIDANQFKADIFIKPARSINFIGLTFVANRTGVSFEEVVGTV
jgi:hypothetical protein